MAQEFLIINIIGCGVAVVGLALSISWSRAVRGFWPGRKKILALSLLYAGIWLLGNIFYFYLKFHRGQL
jgi:hypothetical protein